MKTQLFKFIFLILPTTFLSTLVHAQDSERSVMTTPRPVIDASEWKPHVGLFITAAEPSGQGYTSSEFAVDVGFQPYIPFGAAAEFSHARIDDGTDTYDRNIIWAKGTYNLGGNTTIIKDSYFGLGLGTVFQNSRTALAAAPIVGFDIPIRLDNNQIISLGVSSRYVFVSDGDVDTFSLSGVAKYWF